jgi:hypothetical protein
MRRYPPLGLAQAKHLFHLKDGKLFWNNPPKQRAHLTGKEAGTEHRNSCGKIYIKVKIGKKSYQRSAIIFLMSTGKFPSDQIDHIDGNSLNDLPDNLREATSQQNAQNRRRLNASSHLPMGVRVTPSGRFQARIRFNGHLFSLGTFKGSAAASAAYVEKRKELFGEFA